MEHQDLSRTRMGWKTIAQCQHPDLAQPCPCWAALLCPPPGPPPSLLLDLWEKEEARACPHVCFACIWLPEELPALLIWVPGSSLHLGGLPHSSCLAASSSLQSLLPAGLLTRASAQLPTCWDFCFLWVHLWLRKNRDIEISFHMWECFCVLPGLRGDLR